ncbi:MAG: conjugal transfer protein TraG, partial [Pseudomonadota bacterium]
MIVVAVTTTGAEHWLAGFGKTEAARLMLGRAGLALPYALAGGAGLILLFAAAGAIAIRAVGWGVVTGSAAVIGIAVIREGVRLAALAGRVPAGQSVLAYADPGTSVGAAIAFVCAMFALRVAIKGNAAFAAATPRRITG